MRRPRSREPPRRASDGRRCRPAAAADRDAAGRRAARAGPAWTAGGCWRRPAGHRPGGRRSSPASPPGSAPCGPALRGGAPADAGTFRTRRRRYSRRTGSSSNPGRMEADGRIGAAGHCSGALRSPDPTTLRGRPPGEHGRPTGRPASQRRSRRHNGMVSKSFAVQNRGLHPNGPGGTSTYGASGDRIHELGVAAFMTAEHETTDAGGLSRRQLVTRGAIAGGLDLGGAGDPDHRGVRDHRERDREALPELLHGRHQPRRARAAGAGADAGHTRSRRRIRQWFRDNPGVTVQYPSVVPQLTAMSDEEAAVLLPEVNGPNAAGRQCRMVLGFARKGNSFSEAFVDPDPPIAVAVGRRLIFPCPRVTPTARSSPRTPRPRAPAPRRPRRRPPPPRPPACDRRRGHHLDGRHRRERHGRRRRLDRAGVGSDGQAGRRSAPTAAPTGGGNSGGGGGGAAALGGGGGGNDRARVRATASTRCT